MLRAVVKLPGTKFELSARNKGKPSRERIEKESALMFRPILKDSMKAIELPVRPMVVDVDVREEHWQLLANRADDMRVYECRIVIHQEGHTEAIKLEKFELLMNRTLGWPMLMQLIMQRLPDKWRTEQHNTSQGQHHRY